MRLIRCKIENFGVLSNYSYEFKDGLSVILEPNGSGKSTLAAFIKAMFYGLPSRGARNVVENERKRYEPWQGGNYGGFLEFEYQGLQYRVTRQFGQTAARDRCEIRDLINRKTCDFAGMLGEQIFQLDAESFSRSVFLSASEQSLSATTSIRSKLSDLVDNTNDLNNYDTAVNRLKQKRTQYQPYRGTGGSVQGVSDEIEQTKQKLLTAEEERQPLAELEKEITQTEALIAEKTEAIKHIRKMINAASTQEMRLNQQKQLNDLRGEIKHIQIQLHELDGQYPNGYPSREEIELQRSVVSTFEHASKALAEGTLSVADREIYEKDQALFPDPVLVKRDLEDCQAKCVELEGVSAKLNAQMLPEELKRLEELRTVFQDSPPSAEDLDAFRGLADELKDKERRLAELGFSAEDQSRFRTLNLMFSPDIPSNEQIEACEKQQQVIAGLKERKRAMTLSAREEADWEPLSRTFASGVPTEQEIREQQQAGRRIAELTGIKSTKTAITQNQAEAKNKSILPLLLGILGALLVAGGVVSFILIQQTPGIVLLAVGFLAILLALWWKVKKVTTQPGSTRAVLIGSAITEEQNQELYALQHSLNDFILRFYRTAEDQDKQLTQLFLDREKYLALREKIERFEQDRKELDREIYARSQDTLKLFEKYYPEQTYWDGFTNDLMRKLNEYVSLKNRQSQQNTQKERLAADIAEMRASLKKVLLEYDPKTASEETAGIQRLISEAQEYAQLCSKQKLMHEGNDTASDRSELLTGEIEAVLKKYSALTPGVAYSESLRQLRERFDTYQETAFRVIDYLNDKKTATGKKEEAERELLQFFRQYGISGTDYRSTIQAVDDDARRHDGITERLEEANQKLTEFCRTHPDVEDGAELQSDLQYDLNSLQTAEANVQQECEALQAELSRLQQQHDTYCRKVEEIPELQDRLARLRENLSQYRTNVRLLDETILMLEQAKDKLADSYVGKIEQSFCSYADKLFAGKLGEVMVDNNLQLTIGAQGKQREVGSFSTGTIESIVLCMRMALVDSLFTKEQPFIVLDDPFVNLDDAHTTRSLEIIKELAKERQVIYLVCNSSRC